MRKIIFGIVALFIATFGLYAFTNFNSDMKDSELKLTTYYAVRIDENSNDFTWTDDFSEIATENLTCKPLQGASCSVQSVSKPADNHMPSGQIPTNQAYQ